VFGHWLLAKWLQGIRQRVCIFPQAVAGRSASCERATSIYSNTELFFHRLNRFGGTAPGRFSLNQDFLIGLLLPVGVPAPVRRATKLNSVHNCWRGAVRKGMPRFQLFQKNAKCRLSPYQRPIRKTLSLIEQQPVTWQCVTLRKVPNKSGFVALNILFGHIFRELFFTCKEYICDLPRA
jgi:hypothetical protein